MPNEREGAADVIATCLVELVRIAEESAVEELARSLRGVLDVARRLSGAGQMSPRGVRTLQ